MATPRDLDGGREPVSRRLADAWAWMEARGTRAQVDSLKRYGITADKAFGVSMTQLKTLRKQIGRDQELAEVLWKTGWYEARMLAGLIGDPTTISPATMDAWCRDFDSWAVCDNACFWLFDRTPHAWKKVDAWAKRKGEFERRAAFALIASIALHDKHAADDAFVDRLPLIETAASDERNFVKKAVSWALRGMGSRSTGLHTRSVALARRLAESKDKTERWVGKDVLRDLSREIVAKRVAKRATYAAKKPRADK